MSNEEPAFKLRVTGLGIGSSIDSPKAPAIVKFMLGTLIGNPHRLDCDRPTQCLRISPPLKCNARLPTE